MLVVTNKIVVDKESNIIGLVVEDIPNEEFSFDSDQLWEEEMFPSIEE